MPGMRCLPSLRPLVRSSGVVLAVLCSCFWGLATAGAQAPSRVLHEYVSPSFLAGTAEKEGTSSLVGTGEIPEAIERDGARLPPPGADEGPPFATDSPDGIPRPREARPDRDTTEEGQLEYQAIFNPTVAPLRRNVAFDVVSDDYRWTVASSPRVVVPILGRRVDPGRELFWGSVVLDLSSGDAPLPSVSPDMRILVVETTPSVAITVVRDHADNFYIRGSHPGAVRVVLLVDAGTDYFSGTVPENVALGVGAGRRGTGLPPSVVPRGREVMKTLGLDVSMPLNRGLDRLVGHFRAYLAGPPARADPDIYLDLALGGVGVCRHRAFAFAVTARAAGVPTRLVHNEAHAFVEVQLPSGRWRRVDLGGQAPSLQLNGAEEKQLHAPRPDAFPKPASYLAQYSAQLMAKAQAALDSRLEGQGTGPGEGPGEGGGASQSGASEIENDAVSTTDDGPPAQVPLPEPEEVPTPAPVSVGDAAPTTPAVTLRPVRVELSMDGEHQVAFRGESPPFAVSGRVIDAGGGGGLAEVEVQVHLMPTTAGSSVALWPVGTTNAEGQFSISVRLPGTLKLGDYGIVVASGPKGLYGAGRSDGSHQPAP